MTSQVRLNYMGTPRDKTMSMKEWALSYAARDWPVFPVHSAVAGVCSCGNGTCKDVGKHPRTMHGFKDASTDPKIINEWWDESPNANIGMPTGEVSGLVVVDVDRKSGGLETWVDFQDFHGRVDTLTTLTGGGGFHHFFQTNSQQFKSSAGRLGDGIDIRANGGYIILPPSVHAPGDVYEWEADDDVIAPIPDWLVSKMRNIGKQPSTPAPETNGTVVEGSRNDSLTQLAGAARRAGASVAGINAMLQQENTANCNPPLDVSEVAGIAHSISRYDPARLPLIGSTDDAEWDVVDAVLLGEGKSFYLRAADIRKGKTGVHAKVEVGLNKTILGFSVLNSDRSRDRQDLIKGCSKRLDAMGHSAIGGEVLAAYLDDFCRNLWRNSIKDFAAAKVGGDPSIPVVMAVGDYIIVGGGTIMSAPPGRGKSYVALLMAISADAGTSKVWPVPKAQKALYVNLERSKESIQRRIGQCNVALDLEPGRPMLVLNARGKSLADVRYAVESAVKNDGVEVLFLDSISRSGQGSLLGDQETNSTIDLLNNLCPTWLAIGHTPRSDDSHVFGSIHFEAGADLIVRLASEPADNRLGIGLKVEKANDTPRPPMQYLALEFDSHGLNKVRHAHYGEFPELEDQKLSIENLLVDYIKGKGGKTDATNAAKDLGLDRSVVSTTLNQGLKFVKLEKVGKSQFFGVKTNATP